MGYDMKFDHLVIGAADLEQGVAYIKDQLGIDIPFGGVHITMGTHNHLVQLGNEVFLEIIAVNPEIDAPESPRWYGLDDPFILAKIQQQATLLAWVVNTESITNTMQGSQFSFGEATLVTRGDLSWHFGIPDDGRLLAGGMLPYIIEWHSELHPSEKMADLGCRFQQLDIYHPNPIWLTSILESIGADTLVNVIALGRGQAPYLEAIIDTPKGIKHLRSV